jgi:L-idonate 5-dehydrogenase
VVEQGIDHEDGRLATCAPEGFDLGFEASGAPQALRLAIQACARGATIVQLGTLPVDSPVPANPIMSKEQAFIGSFRFADVFAKVLDLIDGGRVSVSHLVTNVFAFEEFPAALEAAGRKGSVIKVQVQVSPQ